jgi:hypothetical protein
MKIIFFLFILVGTYSFSQDKIFEAKVINSQEFSSSKISGVFEFLFPSQTQKEVISKNADYYTSFFNVDYNDVTKIVKITMLTNDSQSRQIMNRFFISNKISQIEMNGKLFKVEEFYQKQLK